MGHFTVSKGLNLPVEGQASGEILAHPLGPFAYDLRPFSHLPLKLAVSDGQEVNSGDVLAFIDGGLRVVAPVGATVLSIVRGERRRLLEIRLVPTGVMPAEEKKEHLFEGSPASIATALNDAGLLCLLRSRPFGLPVDPHHLPRSIFVQAIETAPLTPPVELQVTKNEEAFQTGLRLLSKLGCPVHVVTPVNSVLQNLAEGCGVQTHTIEGPHPAANPSVHIARIDPIRSLEDLVWVIPAKAVVTIGNYCLSGQLWSRHVVAICGTGLPQQDRKIISTFPGFHLLPLLHPLPDARIISGDPLTGAEVVSDSFARWSDSVICAIQGTKERPALHFLRPRATSFSATHTYIPSHKPCFSTTLHGEERAYIDGAVYEGVMPFGILPIQLVKAVLARDFERAIEYGFLEVVPEDFALADFVCPSKNSMMEIIRSGQEQFLHEQVAARKSA